jgi:hypothetical protein
MGRQGMHTEFWWANFLVNVYLVDQERDVIITLRWIFGISIVKIGDG